MLHSVHITVASQIESLPSSIELWSQRVYVGGKLTAQHKNGQRAFFLTHLAAQLLKKSESSQYYWVTKAAESREPSRRVEVKPTAEQSCCLVLLPGRVYGVVVRGNAAAPRRRRRRCRHLPEQAVRRGLRLPPLICRVCDSVLNGSS